jgi:serine protease AprX
MVDKVDLLGGSQAMRNVLTVTSLAAFIAPLFVLSGPLPADASASSGRAAEAIVQFDDDVTPADRRAAVREAGGLVVRDLHVIQALGVRLSRGSELRLARRAGVHAITPNVAMRPAAAGTGERWGTWNPAALSTAFVHSTRADKAWTDPRWHATGVGIAVAVIDTGIAGDLQDFQVSAANPTSRVIASVVTNRDATTATDRYGHGTHVAGLVAGNGRALAASDPLFNRYIGAAPETNLVSIKVSDDDGNAYLMDVIAGLQFVVDHGADYGIRVANLSLGSTLALPYDVDPLDAAVEAAWAHGVVVVTAAGNRGTDSDAVAYSPANDPYVITVGAVDDHGTKDTADDTLAPWSSRGITPDGFAKPELVAPGAHIVAPLAPDSDFIDLCPACVVDGRYFRIGGTSMAAPIVAGIAADILSAHPNWTPDQVKGALTYNSGTLDADGEPIANVRATADGAWEVAADSAVNASKRELDANQGLRLSSLLDPTTGAIDYARASWRRASWRTAIDGLRASWRSTSWTCDCLDAGQSADPTRASWGRASWRSFFGDSPSEYGETSGGGSGAVRPLDAPGRHSEAARPSRASSGSSP